MIGDRGEEIRIVNENLHKRVYDIVRQVPAGCVTTYGQIAAIVDAATPRVVGYAMAAVPVGSGVPWHRVINGRGEISIRRSGSGHDEQRKLLEAEGVVFNDKGRVDLERYAWL